jgi:uncharacterized protein YndB with AHSA1/START domain
MTDRSVTHASFTIERTYDASPARVFRAWADPEAKARWFSGPAEWDKVEHSMDFRVGGRDINREGPPGGPVHTYEARYHDIVPDERIITTYEMYMDETRSSVSVATLELEPVGERTLLRYTEQGAFLDGLDAVASRERGTRDLLEALGTALEGRMAVAGDAAPGPT